MLDIGKIGFHIVMNPFSHRMAFPQCFVTIHFNFQIHIDLVSEHTGAQHIHTNDIFLCSDVLPQLPIIIFSTGGVKHFGQCVFEDVISYLQDTQADDHTGNRIHHRKAEHSTADTQKGTDGGKGIGTVMPCICHKSGRIEQLGIMPGIPEHGFLQRNRHNCRSESDGTGNGKGVIFTG